MTATSTTTPPMRAIRSWISEVIHDGGGVSRQSRRTAYLRCPKPSTGTRFMRHRKWLGHSTFKPTLDVCGDYIPEEDGGALTTPARASCTCHARHSRVAR